MSQTSGVLAVVVIFSFIIGIILMALAGDAHGAVFFTGVGLFFIGIMIWMISTVWTVAGVAEKKTREWLNDK